jgi:mRNA interferase MazF
MANLPKQKTGSPRFFCYISFCLRLLRFKTLVNKGTRQRQRASCHLLSVRTPGRAGDYLLVQITSKATNDNLTLLIQPTYFDNNKPLPLTSYIRLHKIFLLNESLIISKAASIKPGFLEQVINNIVQLIK